LIPLIAIGITVGLSILVHFFTFKDSSYVIQQGRIDLSEWNAEQEPSFSLEGEAEFYWNELKISNPKTENRPAFIRFPGSWSMDGIFPGHGFGSYRFIVKKRLGQAISFWPVWPSTASVIYLNGVKVNEGGKVGENAFQHQSGFLPSVAITLPLQQEENEILIEVSNYDLASGGQWADFYVGTEAGLIKRHSIDNTLRSLMLGCLIMLGIYFAIIYSLRRQETAPLFLSLMCLAIACQMSVSLSLGLGITSFRVGMQQFNLGWFAACIAFLYYLRSLYPEETSKTFSFVYSILTVGFALFILFQPVGEYYSWTKKYQILTIFGVCYCIVVLIRCIGNRRDGVLLLSLGAGVLFMATVHDMLLSRMVVPFIRAPIITPSFLFFILCDAYIVSAKAARAYATAEHLSINLKQEVDLRTEEIQQKSQKIETLHRNIMENVLQRYLPSTLVEKILAGAMTFDEAPKSSSITIMFVDLCDFTRQTEQLGPDRIGKILNSFLTKMSETIFAYGGTIDKFLGDGILVLFGAPEPMSAADQVQQATECALAMLESLDSLNKEWVAHHLPAFAMRIGLHRGSAIVGSFGGPKRSDYTVIGHTVNVASRIQGVARPNTVYLSASVRELIDENQWEDVGSMELKGVAGEQQIYRLVATHSRFKALVSSL